MSLSQDLKTTLMKVTGARLAGHRFMAVHGAMTVYREAKMKHRVMTPLANGRTLMPSQLQPLIDNGFLELRSEGSAVVIEETDKRP